MNIRTPVALLVFNRPELTQRVFAEIARARPPILLVIADGPRPDHPSDGERCRATRRVVETIDWPCRVLRDYSETNLGMAVRESSGFNWAFDQVEECIILEDDTLPSASFFPFCEQMLERYRDDERIMHINGFGYQFGHTRTEDSYYFSRITCPWGWASWRRAWKLYDFRVRQWPELRETGWLRDLIPHPLTLRFYQRNLDAAYRGELGTWDVQWTFACFLQSGLSVTPRDDLIMNMGHGRPDATMTKQPDEAFNRPPAEMAFPLRHPIGMVRNLAAETFWIEYIAQEQAREERRPPIVQQLYTSLPAPVRGAVRALLPSRVRRHLASKVLFV
jgi:hypothetical protein